MKSLMKLLAVLLVNYSLLTSCRASSIHHEEPSPNSVIRDIGLNNPFKVTKETGSPVTPTPIVMWHGMGDTCCASFSLGHVKRILQQEIPDVYVNSLSFGSSTQEDFKSGYFANVNDLVRHACQLIANDSRLSEGYHAIGFSQGGQFLRAVAQRCPNGMKTLVTLGAQHQGVYGLPHCSGESVAFCDIIRKLLNYGAYSSWIQASLVQAQYWHDPLAEQEYREKSIFLADINNEKLLNETYKSNLLRLEKLILVQFDNDSMVDPKESESFGWYKKGSTKDVVSFTETDLYTQDRLGLKKLDSDGRLVVFKVPGDHLQLDMEWFKSVIIAKYLRS